MRPSLSEPRFDQYFSMTPTELCGMYRKPKSQVRSQVTSGRPRMMRAAQTASMVS
jgi:hypothetical protein